MINKVILLGNTGKDPEVRNFENGGKVANFSLATSENWKDKDGNRQSKTEWHNVSVFGKLADVVEQYVKKGDSLYIEGKLKTREYEIDGGKRYATDVIIDFGGTIRMLGSKASSGSTSESSSVPEPTQDTGVSGGTDDLPF